MSACTFFRHRECHVLEAQVLQDAIEDLIDRGADACLCYITHTFTGVYKFARLAKRRGLTVMDLVNAAVERYCTQGRSRE